MNIGDAIGTYYDTHLRSGHIPLEVDKQILDTIQSDDKGKLLKVRPYPENEGIMAGEELLRAIHQEKTRLFGLINMSEVDTFEIWYSDRILSFHFYVNSERTEKKIRKQIDAHYPSSEVSVHEETMPDIEEGDWVAGSELRLKKSYLYPLKNPMGVNDFNSDPYRSITSDMVVGGKENIVVQIVFKPAHPSWSVGGIGGAISPFKQSAEELADEIRNEKLVEETMRTRERRPIGSENQLAQEIARQREMSAYNVNVRILSTSKNKQEASANAWSVARAFEQSYKEAGGQQFVQVPKRGNELRDMIKDIKYREFINKKIILTIPEMAALAHIPNSSIETPSIEWNNKSQTRLPATAERFNAPPNANFITLRGNINVPEEIYEDDEKDVGDEEEVDIDELIEQQIEEEEEEKHGRMEEDGDSGDEKESEIEEYPHSDENVQETIKDNENVEWESVNDEDGNSNSGSEADQTPQTNDQYVSEDSPQEHREVRTEQEREFDQNKQQYVPNSRTNRVIEFFGLSDIFGNTSDEEFDIRDLD